MLLAQTQSSLFGGSAVLLPAPVITQPTAIEASITLAMAGNLTLATATTSLTGIVYYFWYLDGLYVGSTTSASGSSSRSFALRPGDQSRLEVLCSNSPDFDPVANAPAGWPARRVLVFTRSLDTTTSSYLIEQQANGGSWSAIATVPADSRTWLYELITPRLTDLTQYAWRVTPINAAGQSGTPVSLGQELIVRTPDAPDFTFTFNSGQITLAAA